MKETKFKIGQSPHQWLERDLVQLKRLRIIMYPPTIFTQNQIQKTKNPLQNFETFSTLNHRKVWMGQ